MAQHPFTRGAKWANKVHFHPLDDISLHCLLYFFQIWMIFHSDTLISTSNCAGQGQTTQGALRRLSEYLRPRRIFIQFPRIPKMACPPPRTN